jgi:FAD:protein FMN transferase
LRRIRRFRCRRNALRLLAVVTWIALSFGLIGCQDDSAKLFQVRIITFGTLVDISIWGAEPELARRAAHTLEQDFNYENDAWYAWRPGALARLNEHLASGSWFAAAPSMLPLIEAGQRLSRASGGLFNPAIGRLIELWGFQRTPPPDHPPAAEAVAALVQQHPSMDDISIQGDRLRCTNAAVKLDLGGYAKGYALDLAVRRLRKMGIENAIINAGGDLRAIGLHGGRPWRIGIRDPRTGGVLASIEVSGDESVMTSGDYQRFFEYQGQRYSHILDPRTGYPAQGTESATVIDGNATQGDAAATALFVAGPEQWPQVAKSMGIRYVLLVDSAGMVHMTPEMAARVHFEVAPRPRVAISVPLGPAPGVGTP